MGMVIHKPGTLYAMGTTPLTCMLCTFCIDEKWYAVLIDVDDGNQLGAPKRIERQTAISDQEMRLIAHGQNYIEYSSDYVING